MDSPKKACNLMGGVELEKFENPHEMQAYMQRKVQFHMRFTAVLTKVMGLDYFKPMTEDEFAAAKDRIFPILDDVKIKTERDLVDFIEGEIFTRIDPTLPPYKWFIVQDYLEGKSLLIYKYHHSFADGLGLIGLMAVLADEYDYSNLINQTKALSCGMKLLVFATLPVTLLMMVAKTIGLKKQDNILKKPGLVLNDDPRCAMSKDCSLTKMKAFCKAHNMTINTLSYAIIATCLKEYYKAKNDHSTDSITVTMPFSFRELPKSPQELQMHNDMGTIPIVLPLKPDFLSAIESTRVKLREGLSYFRPHAIYYYLCLINELPSYVGYFIIAGLGAKKTGGATSIAGPRKSLTWNGLATSRLTYVPATFGDVSNSFAFISHNDRMKLSWTVDSAVETNPQMMIDIFEKLYDEQIANFKSPLTKA